MNDGSSLYLNSIRLVVSPSCIFPHQMIRHIQSTECRVQSTHPYEVQHITSISKTCLRLSMKEKISSWNFHPVILDGGFFGLGDIASSSIGILIM